MKTKKYHVIRIVPKSEDHRNRDKIHIYMTTHSPGLEVTINWFLVF